ncbi:MAG: hypothetical protein ACR2Q3_10640 [Woeseiaceae bacterium]
MRLTRFVYQDGDAFAVYYAAFTDGHSEKSLNGLVGLGEWGDDDAGSDTRRAFPFRIWLDGENFKVGLTDASESPWSDVAFMGRILDRDEALADEWIKDVFHITDHMVSEDPDIVRYFDDDPV